jgi:transposase
MPAKLHHVILTPEQRQKAEIIARSYKHSDRERKRARILLLADTSSEEGGCTDAQVSQQVGVSTVMVEQVRRRFASGGLEAALFHQEQKNRKPRALDGEAEAFLIATVCSAPPEGRARWSLHLLADKLVAEGYAEGVSHETVRQTLKKMNLSLG